MSRWFRDKGVPKQQTGGAHLLTGGAPFRVRCLQILVRRILKDAPPDRVPPLLLALARIAVINKDTGKRQESLVRGTGSLAIVLTMCFLPIPEFCFEFLAGGVDD